MFPWMPRSERPVAAFRGRNITRDASRRRGQPRVATGSVNAGVCRCLGLARGRLADQAEVERHRTARLAVLAFVAILAQRTGTPSTGVSFPLLLSSHLSLLSSLAQRGLCTVGPPGRRKAAPKLAAFRKWGIFGANQKGNCWMAQTGITSPNEEKLTPKKRKNPREIEGFGSGCNSLVHQGNGRRRTRTCDLRRVKTAL